MADINPYLDIIKNAASGDSVRDAIINCMNEINKDTAFTVTDKVISGKISEINNGSPYTAPSGQVWKHVTLNIQQESGEDYPASNVKVIDFEVNDNTPNGEYTADEGEQYGTITVNVSHAGEWEGIVDNVAISTLDLDSSNTYHASTQGYTAVKSVTFTNVNAAAARGGEVINGETYYTVQFKNEAREIVDTQKVLEGATAVYEGPNPPDTNPPGYFRGWDHTLTNVNSSFTTKVLYGSGDISHDTIPTSVTWDDLKTKAVEYPLGSIKTLTVSTPMYFLGKKLTSGIPSSDGGGSILKSLTAVDGKAAYSIPMMLVAFGEEGSTSSWLSTKPIPHSVVTNKNGGSYMGGSSDIYGWAINTSSGTPGNARCADDWGSGYMQQWLNNCFIDTLPGNLKKNIVAVDKSYKGISSHAVSTSSCTIIEKTMRSSLWIPSMKEIHGWYSNYTVTLKNKQNDIETGGIDYGENAGWAPDPSVSSNVITRSMLSKPSNLLGTLYTIYVIGYDDEFTPYEGNPYSPTILDDNFFFGFCL